MRGRVSKSRGQRSHLQLSKASQGKFQDAVASKGVELTPSHRDRSPVGEDFVRGTSLLRSSKRGLDAASTSDSLPIKKARLTRSVARTRKNSGIPARRVNHAKVPGTEPSRRSARLQTQQHFAAGGDPNRNTQLAPPREPRTEAGARPPATSVLEPKVEPPEQLPPATLSQKRRIGGDSDDNEHHLKRARLTQNNLALFEKMARKKGTNKARASAPPDSTVESSTTQAKTISTTTSGFADQAEKNGILHPRHSKPPKNLEDIQERHARSRATASPPDSEYKRYINKVEVARNEATMVFEVGGKLLKEYDDEGYQRVFNQAFTGFPREVGVNNGLSAPQPDFVEGLEKREYRPFPVDDYVSGAILYKDDPFSLALPHLAGEWKGRGKDMEEARLQSAYDGAALVYARNQALSYLGKPDPLGHAEVTTFTTDGTNLNLFAHYAAPSEDGTPEYHQYHYATANVKDSYQGYKDGRRGLRNQQDYARTQSFALRDELKEHWKQRRDPQPIAEGAPLPLDSIFEETNGDGDEAGYEIVEQPCQPTPAASLKPHMASNSLLSLESNAAANNRVPSSGGQKRKASLSSQRSSHESSSQRGKGKNYWKWDAERGQYFHKHTDGRRVTWLEDPEDADNGD